MDTSGPFTPASGLAQFGDRGPWAQRGRWVTEPVTGENFVLLPLPRESTSEQKWSELAQRLATVGGPLQPPRAVINDDDALWLLFEDQPQQTLAGAIAQLGGAVQEQVLPALAQALRAIGLLHDHGLTLRRLSLRDLVSGRPGDTVPWTLLLTPDSGVRVFGAGAEAQEIRGDLIMVAAAAATVLTGRRPSPGRVRTPLRTICPTLPHIALDALDELLDESDTVEPGTPGFGAARNWPGSEPRGAAARALADQLEMEVPGRPRSTAPLPVDATEASNEDTEAIAPVTDARPHILVDDDELDPGSSSAARVLSALGHDPRAVVNGSVPQGHGRAAQGRGAGRPWDTTANVSSPPARGKPLLALAVAAVLLMGGGTAAFWAVEHQGAPETTVAATGELTGGQASASVQGATPSAPGAPVQTPGAPVQTPGAPAQAPTGSAPSSHSPQTTAQHSEVEQAVADLVAGRALALRQDDPAALDAVYTPQSPALEADRQTLDQLEPDPTTGRHAFSDLSMEVKSDSIQVVESSLTSARVTTVVDAQGLPPGQVMTQDIEATLVKDQDGWRLNTVKPR